MFLPFPHPLRRLPSQQLRPLPLPLLPLLPVQPLQQARS